MLSIAIYSDSVIETEILKAKIQDYLFAHKSFAKVISFTNQCDFITVPDSFDIYFMDMESEDDVLHLGQRMMGIDNQCYFIYCSKDVSKAYDCFKIRADYFLRKPIDPDDLAGIMDDIRSKVKMDSVIIKSNQGERRIFINQLNYVNIIRRSVCYHLVSGEEFDGQTLRGSFEKAITPLQNHPLLIFLAPSLLINVSNVKTLCGDHLIFENDEVLYFPKKAYDQVSERWKKYNEM